MSLLSSLDEFDEKSQVGDWAFTKDDSHIAIRLTPSEDGVAIIPICLGSANSGCWGWDGSREAPTLNPSILHHSNPKWHGYLRDGQLVLAD